MSLSMHWLTAQTVTRRTWDPGVNELMVANRWISCAARPQKVCISVVISNFKFMFLLELGIIQGIIDS